MALPLLLGAAKGLIGSGKKKPKSGKEVAGKLVKRKEKEDTKKPSTQKKLAPAQVSGTKFFKGGSSTPKIKKLKPNTGNGQLDNVLESIQSSIAKLGSTIKNFVKFKRKDSEQKTKRRNKMLAKLREVGFGMVGGVLSLGKKLLSKIPFFDRIKNFFVNILLGGLVLMILDNIKPIIEVIKGVVEKVKEVFALINKYLFQPMIEAGKFLIENVLPIINDILKSPPVDFVITQIESLIKTLEDKFPGLKEITKNIENAFDSIKNMQLPGGKKLGDFFDSSSTGSSQISTDGTGEQNLAAFLSTMEASGNQNQADAFQVMLNRTADAQAGGSMKAYGTTLGDQITAKEQFSPLSAAIYGVSEDSAAAAKYGPISRALGNTPEERKKKLLEIASQPNGMEALQKLFGGGSASDAAKVLKDFQTGGSLSQQSATDIGSMVSFRGYSEGLPADRYNRGEGGNFFFDKGSKVGSLTEVSSSSPPALRAPAQAGKSRVETDIEEFRQFRTQFGYTSERKPTLNPENLQIREMGNYGSGNYDISPLADDTNYEINEHKGAGHHENRAFDIPVPSKAVGDKVNQFWKSKGYTTIWQSAGHYNHVHVEVPKNKAAEFFNIAPQQPQVTPPALRSTAEEISKQTDYEKMRTIFMPIEVPTGGGGDTSSGGGGPTVIGSGSAKDTYLQIMMANKLFKE